MAQCHSNLPATADGSVIDTIPPAFKPSGTIDMVVFDVNGTKRGTVRFNSDGTIKSVFGQFTTGTTRFYVTYLV